MHISKEKYMYYNKIQEKNVYTDISLEMKIQFFLRAILIGIHKFEYFSENVTSPFLALFIPHYTSNNAIR